MNKKYSLISYQLLCYLIVYFHKSKHIFPIFPVLYLFCGMEFLFFSWCTLLCYFNLRYGLLCWIGHRQHNFGYSFSTGFDFFYFCVPRIVAKGHLARIQGIKEYNEVPYVSANW
jgi:hypothetical protein